MRKRNRFLVAMKCSFLFMALCLSVISVNGAEEAKQPPIIDRELIFGDPEISYSQISPDGQYISFAKHYKGVRNIYVKGREESYDKAKPITADDRPVPGYFWSRDSKYILYVQDKGGDENFHIYAVDHAANPEEKTGVPPARDLTPIKGIRAYIYAVPKKTPGKMIIGLNDRDASYHDVYRLDIATGERELLIENTEKMASFSYDLEGNVRLAQRQLEDGGFEILRADGDKFTQIYTTTFEESAGPIRFTKDGSRFYMVTNKGDLNLTRLVLFDPKTGEEEVVESDPEGQVDFGSAVFDNATDELIATVYVGDRVRIYPRTEQAKKDLAAAKSKLADGDLNFQSSSEDMRFHIVSVSRDVDPASVYLYDRKSGDFKLLYRSRPELKSEHLSFMKPIRYKARDGMEIPAYLTLPRGLEAKNLPVVIHPHGGPWARDRWGYSAYAQFFANRGYAVLQPNFRGSTGFGKKFLNAGNKEWGTGAMQDDISDGVKYLIDKGIADPKRIAIFGGSYGGYATLAGLAFTPELYAAGISYVGPSNLITLLGSIPPYWAAFIKIMHKRLGDPDDPADRKRMMEQSPLFSADKIAAPLLVVQGANDPRVKQAESDQIIVAMRERGLPVEYLVAEDEGHGFRAQDSRIATSAAMEKFFAKHIGGRYQEDMPEEVADKLAELTVNINEVMLPDSTLGKYAETAPLPKRSVDKLQPVQTTHGLQMQVGEQTIAMELSRRIEQVPYEGATVWRIVSSAKSPMGAAADTFYLDKESLLPIARRATQGPAVVKLNFSKDAITGSMKMQQEVPIDVKLNAEVFPSDAAFEAVLGTLPLAEGYETTYRVFDVLQQKVRLGSLKVVGVEDVTIDAGTYNTYKVELKSLDGGTEEGVINISANQPHIVVKSQSKLPAAMGGGTATKELKSVGEITSKL